MADDITDLIMQQMVAMLPDSASDLMFPPPIFTEMEGTMQDFDADAKSLTAQFPVQQKHLNPFGYVQGGILTTLMDNTIGPLSFLIAPPSVTLSLDTSYLRPATGDLNHIIVTARLTERTRQYLYFTAEARSPSRKVLATGQATHHILPPDASDTNDDVS